jgi:hypothetical protein
MSSIEKKSDVLVLISGVNNAGPCLRRLGRGLTLRHHACIRFIEGFGKIGINISFGGRLVSALVK